MIDLTNWYVFEFLFQVVQEYQKNYFKITSLVSMKLELYINVFMVIKIILFPIETKDIIYKKEVKNMSTNRSLHIKDISWTL